MLPHGDAPIHRGVSTANFLFLKMQNLSSDNEIYKNKYRIPSTRMANWDYSSHGLYYVTICTLNRIPYFGEIISRRDVAGPETPRCIGASLQPTPLGEIAVACRKEIPNHFPFVGLDDFVIMPNHIHGILFINNPHKEDWIKNKFGPQSKNLGSVIRGFKAAVKTYATKNDIDFGWHPRYYDHVIRTEKEYLAIGGYIVNNPNEWLQNGDNEDNIFRP